MAKSFSIHPPAETGALKPASERDLFDLLAEPVVTAVPSAESPTAASSPPIPAAPSDKAEVSLDQPAVEAAPPCKPPAKRVRQPKRPASPAEPAPPVSLADKLLQSVVQPTGAGASTVDLAELDIDDESVRQTFVIGRYHLEQLRDFVHAQRAAGNYLYSQRQALEDALMLLFATQTPAARRPPHIIELEQRRRTQIKKGRRTGPEKAGPSTSA